MHYQLAVQQFERGQIDAAIDTITEAIAADDSSAEQYLLLAHCRLEQGKLASAREAALRAQRCDPQSAEVEYTLGVLAERTDDLTEALEHYHQAGALDAGVVDYLVAEAECLAALGRPESALMLVSENLGRFDSDGTLEMLLGQICLLIGDRESAVHHLRLAMERSGCGPMAQAAPAEHTVADGPTGCDVLIEEYGRLLSETGRSAEAVTLLRPYVETRPDVSPSVVTALAVAQLNLNRADEAKQLLRDEVRRSPDHLPSWMLLAQAAVRTDDWLTARRCAERLEQLAPHSAPVHLLYGFVCWKQNDWKAAEASLRQALSADADDALAHCLIGQVLEDTGRPAAAEEHYRRAQEIDPSLTRGSFRTSRRPGSADETALELARSPATED